MLIHNADELIRSSGFCRLKKKEGVRNKVRRRRRRKERGGGVAQWLGW